jgi:hypothetical protein
MIGFIEHLQKVTTNNYGSLAELHAPKITVTTAHIKSSQFAIVTWLIINGFWIRLIDLLNTHQS